MIYRSFLLVLLLLTIWLPATAQDSRGSISGRVSDPSGSSIASVQVQATNTGTGASVDAVTNDSGNYTLPFLLPGVYNVNAGLTGFQKLERKGVEVRVNDSVTVDLQLSVGDVSQSIEVSGATPLLEIGAVNLGQVYDTARITDLPIQSGNPAELAKSSPGTVSISSLGIQKAAFNNGLSQMVTNGNTAYSNEFMIDGVPNTFAEGTLVRIAFSPPQSALSEFKSQTTSYDASLGHTPGAVVNMITAGGTAKYHGEVHEFWGGSALDTATFFQNSARISKLPYTDNRYGGSFGGPVPFVGNRKEPKPFSSIPMRRTSGAPPTSAHLPFRPRPSCPATSPLSSRLARSTRSTIPSRPSRQATATTPDSPSPTTSSPPTG